MTSPEPATRPAPDTPRMTLWAVVLTVAFPGAGHALLRDWARAVIWAIGWFAVGVAGGGHSLALLALTAIAAIDAYARASGLTARAEEARA